MSVRELLKWTGHQLLAAVYWLPVLLGASLIACWLGLAANLFNLEAHWQIVGGLASGVITGILVFLVYMQRLVERLNNRLESFLAMTSRALFSLSDCQEDLKQRLGQVEPGKKIIMYHLGLDMERAWLRIKEALENLNQPQKIELRLLVITEHVERLGSYVSDELRRWCERVGVSLRQIREDLARLSPGLKERRVQLIVEVRAYCEIPTVHGFSVERPFRARYFSFCRWRGTRGETLDWGDRHYRRIIGDPSEPSARDLTDQFDGAIKHLWNSSATETLLIWP